MVKLAHRRYEIERFYQDAKNELGFDPYEETLWYGLHRDPTFVMWAYSQLAAKRHPRIERITDTCLPANAPVVAVFFSLQTQRAEEPIHCRRMGAVPPWASLLPDVLYVTEQLLRGVKDGACGVVVMPS